MGQDRKNGESNTRRLRTFEEEILDDQRTELVITIRQIMLMIILIILVVLREYYYPSDIFITDLF